MAYSRFSAESLQELARDSVLKLGAPDAHARAFADGLVIADVRGIESHGIARLPSYVALIEHGLMDIEAAPSIAADAPATAVVDAHNGLGHVAGAFAMHLAIGKARVTGMSWVTVRNSNHFGIAGYYAGMALEHGMIGLCGTNTGPVVAPMGGRTRMLGTNPIALAAPAGSEDAFLLDMATSAVAAGKLQVASWEREPVPKGWGLDTEGRDCTDPDAILAEGAMLPLGSFLELAGYKGYGLAMMVEVLSGVLGGGLFAPDVRNLSITPSNRPSDISHFFAALDVGRFLPVDEFKQRMDQLIRSIRASPLAPGFERIYIPGEKEQIAERDRRLQGIPLHPRVVERLVALAERLGLPFPPARS